jgi:hypothetical protein
VVSAFGWGARYAARWLRPADGRLVRTYGIVTLRQQPEMADGTVFVSLEDETGVVKVILYPQLRVESRCSRNWHQTGTSTDQKTKKSAGANLLTLLFLAPRPGLEPGTYGLTVRRSTN